MFPNQANPNINMNYINRIRNMEDMFYQMNPKQWSNQYKYEK